MSFKHKPGLPFIWNCFTQWSKQIRINNTGYLCRVTKIKYYQAIEQREQKNDTYLQNCIKTILLSENFLTANQNSSKTVKGLNHFSTFLFFTMTLTIKFSAILSLYWFGDHALLFPGSTTMMLWLQASCSPTSCDCSLFFFIQPNDPKSRNAYDAKWKHKKGMA